MREESCFLGCENQVKGGMITAAKRPIGEYFTYIRRFLHAHNRSTSLSEIVYADRRRNPWLMAASRPQHPIDEKRLGALAAPGRFALPTP
ncbi:hypothetical protein [Adlercreutzia sp. ZJ473]|uniref:hypothetical protein n=1 Tax=Adlercreutzia sp. ZJ473 TaxID=2722822 RepID=UPI001553ED08|nr:hypothetical protein [Adlercreutzia sp. ZJ473]